MRTFKLLFCFALFLCGQGAALAWERPAMSKYGASYEGAEQLTVQLAHTAADNHAVLKISGINHPWDGRVFWVQVRYTPGHPERIQYVSQEKGEAERILLFLENGHGTLNIPNWRGVARAELAVSYSGRDASAAVLPEHLATDYEKQIGQAK
ncbi:MAG: hypothetical protein LBP52_10770 [Burkholderiaceae bacterium]|jgi:hypothetical protein|nr:hypothetical protein [Burkholderiaceae bacterium]